MKDIRDLLKESQAVLDADPKAEEAEIVEESADAVVEEVNGSWSGKTFKSFVEGLEAETEEVVVEANTKSDEDGDEAPADGEEVAESDDECCDDEEEKEVDECDKVKESADNSTTPLTESADPDVMGLVGRIMNR